MVQFQHMDFLIISFAEYLLYIAFVYAVLHTYFLHEKKHHIRHIATMVGVPVFAWLISHTIKDIVAHPRPDLSVALIVPDSLYSFPSGHATLMFALAATMYAYDKKAGLFLAILAILTGIARVLAGVHYWYDIVAGAVLGYVVSLVVVIFLRRVITKR
jgi:undecaprenyl-diphosphatase